MNTQLIRPCDFYLINSDWIRAFKKHYNYKAIMDNYNYGVEVLNNNIKITQEFPDNLKQQNSLNFSSCTISNTNLSFSEITTVLGT